MVKKGWKQLSIHDSLWERMRRQVDLENEGKPDWEKKLSCNKYAELSIAAQLKRDARITQQHQNHSYNRNRPMEIDTIAIG